MRVKRSRSSLVVLAVGLVCTLLVVSGCGGSDSGSGSTTGGSKPTVGVVLPDINAFPAYAAIMRGMRAQAARAGVNLEFASTTGTFTPQKYQDAIDSMVARGMKAFGFDAYDGRLFTSVIRRLEGQGIKVVTIGDPPLANETSSVNTDTRGAIDAAMKQFIKEMGGPGDVAILEVPGNGVVTARVNDAKAALESAGATVVAQAPVGTACDEVRGANAAEDVLQAHPELRGMFVPCGPPAVGAAKALSQAGKHVVIYSFDGSPDELRAIKAGTLTGTIGQRFGEVGAKTIDVLKDIAQDKPVARSYLTGFDVITRDNVDQFSGN
jgi:ABC-type sugar transport system substrate-binding protein